MAVRRHASAPEAREFGDSRVSVYVPSRYANGTPIPPGVVSKCQNDCQVFFAGQFGGSTCADVTGTYLHDDGRPVVEPIKQVFAAVPRQSLDDNETRKSVLRFAAGLAAVADQECIAVEWGGEMLGVMRQEDATRKPKVTAFANLPPSYQVQLVSLVLRTVTRPEHIASVLALGGWRAVDEPTTGGRSAAVRKLAAKGGNSVFASGRWLTRSDLAKNRGLFASGDIVVCPDADPEAEGFRIWLITGDGFRGSRFWPTIAADGDLPAVGVQLALAVLEARVGVRLADVIDQEAMTSSFFMAFRNAVDECAQSLIEDDVPGEQAEAQAQVQLGRLVFVKFLEAKGWLDQDPCYVARNLKRHTSRYNGFLKKLYFKALDVPEPDRIRSLGSQALPYINGGLFEKTEWDDVPIPDSILQPGSGSAIDILLQRYDYSASLDQSRQFLGLDPSIFGHVLEGLCNQTDRKQKGVFYTPVAIARELARSGLVNRLARLTGIPVAKLRGFVFGADQALAVRDAETLLKTLFSLRVIDPAVGSGALLIAVLEEMMGVYVKASRILGLGVEPGGVAWSGAARRIVRECLFGVDIDPKAVEVAKQRLWLAITIGENSPEPLPLLSHNIRVGDSLAWSEPLGDLRQRELAFDAVIDSRQKCIDKFVEFRQAGGRAGRALERELTACERDYAVKAMEAAGNESAAREIADGGPIPFNWQIHFADVFSGHNRGFDLVIANPPYVSAQNLAASRSSGYDGHVEQYRSLQSGAKDLYLAFVELALNLGGKSGEIAYIMPNFSRTSAGRNLRSILGERGAVSLWVDFGDIQVFSAATNYVALLFGTAKKSRRSKIRCRVVSPAKWPPESGQDWLAGADPGSFSAGEVLWRASSNKQANLIQRMEAQARPLGELFNVEVGVQTSADKVFLLESVIDTGDGYTECHSRHLDRTIKVETALLRRIAKGSRHLKEPLTLLDEGMRILWPYDGAGRLLATADLAEKSPMAWQYLRDVGKYLRGREDGKFDDAKWYRFGRSQGVAIGSREKIIVPSILRPAVAYWDRAGAVAFTASGKGGGGAWGLTARNGDSNLAWVLAILNSQAIWTWLQTEGDPKQGGWRGVDKSVLERVPVKELSAAQARRLGALFGEQDRLGAEAFLERTNGLVGDVYGI